MMTLTPSQQSVVIQGITIVNDSVLEGPETFTLSLGSPVGAPGGVGLGTPSTTVTIIDNESTCIYMSHNYSDDLFSYNIECVYRLGEAFLYRISRCFMYGKKDILWLYITASCLVLDSCTQ